MAGRSTFPLRGYRPDRIVIAGTFVPNGAGAIDQTQNEGAGANTGNGGPWSVARTAAGQYTITLGDQFSAIENVDAELQSLTAQSVIMQVVSKTPGTGTNTVVLGGVAGGVFADIPAAVGTKVHFQIVCKNSGVNY